MCPNVHQQSVISNQDVLLVYLRNTIIYILYLFICILMSRSFAHLKTGRCVGGTKNLLLSSLTFREDLLGTKIQFTDKKRQHLE